MIERIFLDLDGVVRDWVRGINEYYHIDVKEEEITKWNYLTEFVMDKLKISEYEFWENQNELFWTGLKFTSEAPELLSYLESIRIPVFLFSAPTLNNAGWSQNWIKNNLPQYFNTKQYLIGPVKWVCANPNSLLIDDAEKNIIPWTKAGGIGLLWPKPWNYAYGFESGMVYLKDLIEFHNN
jgi:hypothetical protein